MRCLGAMLDVSPLIWGQHRCDILLIRMMYLHGVRLVGAAYCLIGAVPRDVALRLNTVPLVLAGY